MSAPDKSSAVAGCCVVSEGRADFDVGAMSDECGCHAADDYNRIGAEGARVAGDRACGVTSVYKGLEEGAVAVESTVGKVGYANYDMTLRATHIEFETVRAGRIEVEPKVVGTFHCIGSPLPVVTGCVAVTNEIVGTAKTTVYVEIDWTSGAYTAGVRALESTVERAAVTEPYGLLEDSVWTRYVYLMSLEVAYEVVSVADWCVSYKVNSLGRDLGGSKF